MVDLMSFFWSFVSLSESANRSRRVPPPNPIWGMPPPPPPLLPPPPPPRWANTSVHARNPTAKNRANIIADLRLHLCPGRRDRGRRVRRAQRPQTYPPSIQTPAALWTAG